LSHSNILHKNLRPTVQHPTSLVTSPSVKVYNSGVDDPVGPCDPQ